MCGWNGARIILYDISEVAFTVGGTIVKVYGNWERVMYCTTRGINSCAHGFKLAVMAFYNCCASNIPQNIPL